MVRLLDSWILGWLGFWILKNCIRYQVIIPTSKVSNYKVDHVKLIIDNLKCNILFFKRNETIKLSSFLLKYFNLLLHRRPSHRPE